jgi:hypothetical protein
MCGKFVPSAESTSTVDFFFSKQQLAGACLYSSGVLACCFKLWKLIGASTLSTHAHVFVCWIQTVCRLRLVGRVQGSESFSLELLLWAQVFPTIVFLSVAILAQGLFFLIPWCIAYAHGTSVHLSIPCALSHSIGVGFFSCFTVATSQRTLL